MVRALVAFVRWSRRAAVRRRAGGLDGNCCDVGLGGRIVGWGCDHAVVSAHPVILQPADGRRDASTTTAPIVFDGGAAAPSAGLFARGNRAGAAGVRGVAG